MTGGSSDRFVHVWDTTSRALLYKLPGHKGAVNEVQFHPKEPIGAFFLGFFQLEMIFFFQLEMIFFLSVGDDFFSFGWR